MRFIFFEFINSVYSFLSIILRQKRNRYCSCTGLQFGTSAAFLCNGFWNGLPRHPGIISNCPCFPWQHTLMDSATTHEQTMPPHRQFGFVYGILLFYGCQEPPQNVTIPLSPHHNLLPLLCHLPSRQRRQTRFCKGSLAFCPRQPPPFGCFRHTDWRLIFPLHASAAIFCCFYSKCTETALADSHAFTVEAGFSFSLL